MSGWLSPVRRLRSAFLRTTCLCFFHFLLPNGISRPSLQHMAGDSRKTMLTHGTQQARSNITDYQPWMHSRTTTIRQTHIHPTYQWLSIITSSNIWIVRLSPLSQCYWWWATACHQVCACAATQQRRQSGIDLAVTGGTWRAFVVPPQSQHQRLRLIVERTTIKASLHEFAINRHGSHRLAGITKSNNITHAVAVALVTWRTYKVLHITWIVYQNIYQRRAIPTRDLPRASV